MYLLVSLQFKYDINKVQLKMLQITSHEAQQRVTIRCKNLAIDQPKFRGFKKGTHLTAEILQSGCEVSSKDFKLCTEFCLSVYLFVFLS